MPKIHVIPSNKVIETEVDSNLRDALIKSDYYIKSTCGGCASCGLCSVVIVEGEQNLNEFSFEEKQLLGNVFHITRERLSCQVFVQGDITVDISAHKKVNPVKVVRKTKDDLAQKDQETKEIVKKQGGFRRPKAFKTEE